MTDENETPEVEEHEAPDTTETQETDVEQQAREMGWRPQEEWDGDPDRWMPAEDFVERNDRLKNRGDKILKTENQKLSRELEELRRTVGDLKQYMTRQEKNAYDRAYRDLRQRQEEAVAEGDVEGFRKIEREREQLDKNLQEQQSQQDANQPQRDPDFEAWVEENPWFGKDPKLTVEAQQISYFFEQQGYSGRQLYDAVADYVKQEHPQKFRSEQDKPKRSAPSVEGTGRKPAGSTKWSKVDKDGADAFKRFVKQGIFKDTKEDRERFADDYLNG